LSFVSAYYLRIAHISDGGNVHKCRAPPPISTTFVVIVHNSRAPLTRVPTITIIAPTITIFTPTHVSSLFCQYLDAFVVTMVVGNSGGVVFPPSGIGSGSGSGGGSRGGGHGVILLFGVLIGSSRSSDSRVNISGDRNDGVIVHRR
jgi:hypothetical protein